MFPNESKSSRTKTPRGSCWPPGGKHGTNTVPGRLKSRNDSYFLLGAVLRSLRIRRQPALSGGQHRAWPNDTERIGGLGDMGVGASPTSGCEIVFFFFFDNELQWKAVEFCKEILTSDI